MINTEPDGGAIAALLMRRLPRQTTIDPVRFRARSFLALHEPPGLLIEDAHFDAGQANLEIRQQAAGGYSLIMTAQGRYLSATCISLDAMETAINNLATGLLRPANPTLTTHGDLDLKHST